MSLIIIIHDDISLLQIEILSWSRIVAALESTHETRTTGVGVGKDQATFSVTLCMNDVNEIMLRNSAKPSNEANIICASCARFYTILDK